MISYINSKKAFYKELEDIEVVSFDIFDTLLIRPYKKPVDLFKHIETYYKVPGFSNARTCAEIRARIKAGGLDKETSLDEIYESILPEYTHLKELEKDFEKNLLKRNPLVFELYEAAINYGKKVIAISDMYLPKEFLREILNINGYTKISQIYVSSEYKQNKDSKILYKIAIEDLKTPPEKFLHIGDNLIADFYRAKDCGMKAVLIPKISDEKSIWKKRLHKCKNAFESSILETLFDYNQACRKQTYWKEFGYHLGGPLAVGYVDKIIEISKRNQIDYLLFVSRDGYVLQKVYELLAEDLLENKYIYAPRILNLKCFLDYRNAKGYLEELFRLTSDIVPDFNLKHLSFTDEIKLFEKNKEHLKSFAQKNLDEYLKYIESLNINGSRIASVDMTTGTYSSLYFLKKIFKDKLLMGFFSCAFSNTTEFLVSLYNENIFSESDTPLINLTEFLITAPEAPLEGIKDCKPVYKGLSRYEQIRIDVYKEIMEGILEFAQDYKTFFSKYRVNLSSETVFFLLQEFMNTMTYQDRKKLKTIYHAKDIQSSAYSPLFKISTFKITLKKLGKVLIEIKTNIKRKLKYYIYNYTNKRFTKGKKV